MQQDSYLDFQLQSLGIQHCDKRKKNKACRQKKLGRKRRFESLEARVGYSVRNCSFQFIEQYRSCMPPVVDKIENYF